MRPLMHRLSPCGLSWRRLLAIAGCRVGGDVTSGGWCERQWWMSGTVVVVALGRVVSLTFLYVNRMWRHTGWFSLVVLMFAGSYAFGGHSLVVRGTTLLPLLPMIVLRWRIWRWRVPYNNHRHDGKRRDGVFTFGYYFHFSRWPASN